MIDRLLITRKMSLILEDLAAMTQLSQLSREQYLKDSINEALAERYLERAIGRMIDVNFHLVTESGHAPPKDYHESFILLGTLGVMTVDLARSLSDFAVRHEAKEALADARPQAPKNRRRVRWNTVRIFQGREQRRCLGIVRRSRKVKVGQAPREMATAAGLRNRIVHEYDDIDPERVYEALPVAVRQIPVYLGHIQRFVEKLPQG